VPGRNSIRAAIAALAAGGTCVPALHLLPPLPAVAAAVAVGTAVSWLSLSMHRSTKENHGRAA
jgi:hypothetical protein